MLVGRSEECGLLERLLEEARHGQSAALVLRGEPGIGKSALLRHAVEHAEGFTVLQTRGVESEAELAFAGLTDLTRPLLWHLPALPQVQAEALAGALALGPPTDGDRFTVAVATLSLLGLAAERAPLLAVVDDAHWLDAPSADVMLFVARRLAAEGIVVLLAERDSEAHPLDLTGLKQLVVRGLDAPAAESLLRRRHPGLIAPGVARRLVEVAAGNPLALLEVPSLLSAAQLAGTAPLTEPLPAGDGVERAFLRRVATLPASVGVALLVAATSDTNDLATVVKAIRQLGVGVVALETAESRGLITLADGRVEFRHPLLRSVIYHGASPPARRAAHRVLAAALEENSHDRRAWHLAAAAITADEEIAAALERTALAAQQRGGWGTAASALERAAQLSPNPKQRARRLLAAAEAFWSVGQIDHAVDMLNHALILATDPPLRADIQRLRAAIQGWRGEMPHARQLLMAEAERIATTDPARAVVMLAEASSLSTAIGQIRTALVTAQRGCELARDCRETVQAYAALALGTSLVLGGCARDGYPMILGARITLQREAESAPATSILGLGGQADVWLEEWERGRRNVGQAIGRARARGAPGSLLPFHLGILSELDFRAGRWDEALSGATEAIQLARDTGQRSLVSFGLVCLARVHAGRGEEVRCRASLAEALDIAERYGIRSIEVYAASARGLLELGLGCLDAAISALEPLVETVEHMCLREPAVVQWAPDHIEACIRAGHLKRAREALQRFQRMAAQTGRTWALATAARCRGLLTDASRSAEAFAEAYTWHARVPMPFELARTRLIHGEILRRAKQRSAARECLRVALATFEELDARPWAERARAELRATGAAARRRDVSAMRRFTPQEFQVAQLVAEGRSNREIAAALFLSAKTVEFHVSNIHRKLGTSSRAQLVRLLIERSLPNSSPRSKVPS